MVTQHTDDAQISNMVNKPFFTRLFEAINFVNINAMLSNVATNSVNITGTGVMTNILVGEKILGSIYSKLPGMGGAEGVKRLPPKAYDSYRKEYIDLAKKAGLTEDPKFFATKASLA